MGACSGPEMFSLRISDFGNAVRVRPIEEACPRHLLWLQDTRCVTTHAFASPESLDEYKYTFQSDLFSVGVLLAEALEGHAFVTRHLQKEKSPTPHEIRLRELDALIEQEAACTAFRKKHAQSDSCFSEGKELHETLPDFCTSLLQKLHVNRPRSAEQALDILLNLHSKSKTQHQLPLRDPRRHRLTKKTSGNSWFLPSPWSKDRSRHCSDKKDDRGSPTLAESSRNSASLAEQCVISDESDVWHAFYTDEMSSRIDWEAVANEHSSGNCLLDYASHSDTRCIDMFWAKPVSKHYVKEYCERVYKLEEGEYQPGSDVW